MNRKISTSALEVLRGRERLIVALLLFSVAAAGTFGQLTVTYTEGFPEVKEDGSWREVYIGDSVSGDVTVRLERHEYLELDTPRGVLRFDSPGSYRLDAIAGKTDGSDAQAKVLSMIGGRLSSAVKGTDYQVPSAAGGVRGAEAEGGDDLFFMESESLDLIRRGKELLAESADRERLETAARYFEEAKLYAVEPAEENEALFYLGYVALRRGMPEKAMEHLSGADPYPEAAYYGSFLLLAGRVYLMNGQPVKTVELLEETPLEMLTDEERRDLRLLQGIALIKAERPEEALEPLNDVLQAAPSSEAGDAARDLLESIRS